MATKEEYEKALKEMNDAFYGITFEDGARFCVNREQIEFVED